MFSLSPDLLRLLKTEIGFLPNLLRSLKAETGEVGERHSSRLWNGRTTRGLLLVVKVRRGEFAEKGCESIGDCARGAHNLLSN